MAKTKLSAEDKEFLEQCPVCGEGYMVPTMGHWYQCSECGVEAEQNDYGVLLFDSSVKFKEKY